MKKSLMTIYRKLYHDFGPQHWWPGETPFEIAVGAILTQNMNWNNVERAITNLKSKRLLNARKLHSLRTGDIAQIIRPAGYYNVKARRLKAFIDFLVLKYGGSFKKMAGERTETLREQLLDVNGVGPETADSILLYALGRPIFVIDAYTRRVFSRHGLVGHDEPYDVYQRFFHAALKPDVGLYNEYHALLVLVGKTNCKPGKPLCVNCPLHGV